MLSQNDLTTLNQLLGDEGKSFEAIASSFQRTFNKLDQFKIGVNLWCLIKENLLSLTQRLASFYLLYDMYKSEQVKTTPFIPLLLESYEQSKSQCEKRLLCDLLDFKFSNTQAKMTPKQFIDEYKTNDDNDIKLDVASLWKTHNTTKEKITKEINEWIRPVIYENSTASSSENNIETKPPFDLTQLTPEELSFNNFDPGFLTYYPNSSFQFYEDEPMWILPSLKYDFIWDFTMSPEQETISNLINRPLKNKALSEEQTNYLLESIGENPAILKEINFSYDSMMKLIEKNGELATEILFKISKHDGFENYLSLFLERAWTVNSMKVVNKLIQKVEMPKQFIICYLRHIIKSYKDEAKQENKTRIARLAAFFILNLSEHEHINIDMIPKEIEEIFVEKSKDDDILKLQQKITELRKTKDDTN